MAIVVKNTKEKQETHTAVTFVSIVWTLGDAIAAFRSVVALMQDTAEIIVTVTGICNKKKHLEIKIPVFNDIETTTSPFP